MSSRPSRRTSTPVRRAANDNASGARVVELEGFDDCPVEFVEIEVFSQIVGTLRGIAANDNEPPPQANVG